MKDDSPVSTNQIHTSTQHPSLAINTYLRPEPPTYSQSTKNLTFLTLPKALKSSSLTLFRQHHPRYQDNFLIRPPSLSNQRGYLWDSLQSQCPDKTIDTQSVPPQNSAWEAGLCVIGKRFKTLIARKSMDLRFENVLQIQLTSGFLEWGGNAIYFTNAAFSVLFWMRFVKGK